ncbi:HIT family protein [Frankia sp. CNm7]|uniref:HIT family protein n=1 Tax=Frankia nepalensis TaxID=1836974 RepID=A0A937RGL8_9ACTN|nr:HIT family protein [Frankia nepalensis]MBL7500861.1 HIT family protein [Frankia nepalensis]MBL7509227.1 HIT family protein [Frankia nepalensis]MBL7517313.1 HIT family protein [Frankia nepalensis]MBL7627009.1 HIT family protein [Frankia nepalensis]
MPPTGEGPCSPPPPATGCYSCAQNGADPATLPPRERILVADGWRVAHALTAAMPGWLVVVSRRHILSLADLTPAEAAELGVVTWRLSNALAAALGCQKTYVACFCEATGFEHLHIHVIPRAPDLPPDERGPAVFTHLQRPAHHRVPTAEMDRLAGLLARHLPTPDAPTPTGPSEPH